VNAGLGRSSPLLIRGARQLLTLNGPSGPRRGHSLNNLGVIEDGAVLIVNGVITSVGPARRVENLAEAKGAAEISASGRVVIPAFVDPVTNLVAPPHFHPSGPHRQPGNDLANRALKATPARSLLFQARRFVQFFARHGTTTLESKSTRFADEATELKALRILQDLHHKPANVVGAFAAGTRMAPETIRADLPGWLTTYLLPRVAARKMARFAQMPCSEEFSLEEVRTFIHTAAQQGLRPKLELASQQKLTDVLSLMHEVVVPVIEGITSCDASSVFAIARSQSLVVLLPALMFGSASSLCARELIEGGAAVALASGFEATNQPIFNMQTVIGLACRHLGLTVEEAISCATINAAHACDEASRVGSLQFGKDADLLLLNVPDYREIAHFFGANLVHMTLRRGEIIFREGELNWSDDF
jgi:imidazolonepropionase